MTCYSEGELIQDAIASILNQSTLPSEIILVNDFSTHPPTNQVCQQLETDNRIQVIWRSSNGGTSIARNTGFEAAQGEILVPLDADDLLPKDAIALVDQAFTTHPDAGFVYGDYFRQNHLDSELILVSPENFSLRSLLQAKKFSVSSQWQLIGTSPLRRSLWKSVGGYDPEFGVEDLHDVEFWLRAIASDCYYYAISEPIYIWRKYLGNNSRQVTPLAWSRIAQKHFNLYCELGLEYRANELLLLGSKWLNQSEPIKHYSRQLVRCILQGKFQSSSLIALALPTIALPFLWNHLRKSR